MSHQQPFVPIVQITRGIHVESSHRGAVAAVDAGGHLVASLGSAAEPICVRSCAKPFQALAFVCSGAADAFQITDEELAVACASHSGEPGHVKHVQSLLQKAGIDPELLRCGVHPPFDRETRESLEEHGSRATVLHNNCSGKHAAMLATSRFLDLPLQHYTEPEHPVQIAIHGILAYLCGLDTDEVEIAVDGCTAPTFYVPLRGFALAMARLAASGTGAEPIPGRSSRRHDGEPDDEDDALIDAIEEGEDEISEIDDEDEGIGDSFPVPIQEGLGRIWRAMSAHPRLVAGNHGRLCTDLMIVAASFGVPLVAKSGAEGAYAVATVLDDVGLGLAFKVEDGAQRARDSAVIETLFQLEILPEEARGPLAGYHRQTVLNLRQEPVGEIRSAFRLSRGL